MQTPARTPWAEVLLAILGFLGLLFFFGFAALLIFAGFMQLNNPFGDGATQSFVLAVMFGIEALVLIPGLWFLYRKVTDHPDSDRVARLPFAAWHIPLILAVWAVGLLAGQWAVDAPDPAWVLLPFLIPLAVIPPIWLTLNLAARGYDFRPRWRGWATVTIGSTLGPFIMLTVEIFVILAAIAAVVLFVVLQPEVNLALQQLSSDMERAVDPAEALALLAPLLTHPLFIGGLLFVVSIVIPLIEELLKPLAVWLFAKQMTSPRDGFVIGAVSGAAYALFETGGLGSAAGSEWLFILGARGGTSLLHIVTSAIMGAAIVGAIRERRYARLAGIYFASILLHGLWNAFSIFDSLGEAARVIDPKSMLVTLGNISPYGLGAVALVLLVIVIAVQRRYQKAAMPVELPSGEETVAP